MIIAVDFDGTLCEHKYPDIGKPNEELISLLINIQKAGTRIILWTCRSGEYLKRALAWCGRQGLLIDAANEDIESVKNSDFGREKSCKVYADIYIDDRNCLISQFINPLGGTNETPIPNNDSSQLPKQPTRRSDSKS